MSLLDRVVGGNSLAVWVLAAAVTLGAALLLLFVRRQLVQRLRVYAATTATKVDDVVADIVGATHALSLVALSLYIGAQLLELPAKAVTAIDRVAVIVLLLQVGLWVNRVVSIWLARHLDLAREHAAAATTAGVLGFIARVVVWVLVVLMALDNLGFNITTLVASLGIGGIAVALAVQNILGDIFASLSIALDKPFVIGDFIIVDDALGTVEYIGLKTTRVRSLSGEQIVFSNAELLTRRIRNFKRMVERRVLFNVGVVYGTPQQKLERIPALVRAIIERQGKTRFDRAHFKEYGDSALVFEIVFYVLDADYNVYMDKQQAINLELYRCFRDEGIEFAFPTRTLHVVQAPTSAAPIGSTARS